MGNTNPKHAKLQLHSNNRSMLGVPGELKQMRETNQNNRDSVKFCEPCKKAWQWERYQERSFSFLPDFPTIGLPRDNCPDCQGIKLINRHLNEKQKLKEKANG